MKLDLLKRGGCLLMAASMLAACSTTTASSTAPSASDTPSSAQSQADSSQKSSLLDELISSADDDDKALAAWTAIFEQEAADVQNTFEVEGDSEVYEYETADDSAFVEKNFIYNTARQSLSALSDGALYTAQYRIVDNSYNTFENGTGLLYRTGDESTGFLGELTQTGDDLIDGKVKTVLSDIPAESTLPASILYDTYFSGGYVRSVDPVHNASLYTYDLQKDGSETKLVIKVKDLDKFHQAAATITPAVTYPDERPTLILNEITDETWTVFFNEDDTIKQVDANIFHAISSVDDKVYINIRTKVDTEDFEEADAFVKAASPIFDQVKDGSLKEGSDFTIQY